MYIRVKEIPRGMGLWKVLYMDCLQQRTSIIRMERAAWFILPVN